MVKFHIQHLAEVDRNLYSKLRVGLLASFPVQEGAKISLEGCEKPLEVLVLGLHFGQVMIATRGYRDEGRVFSHPMLPNCLTVELHPDWIQAYETIEQYQ